MQYSALSRAGHSKGQLLASEVPSLLLHAVCSATRVDCHWRERPKHQNRQVLLLLNDAQILFVFLSIKTQCRHPGSNRLSLA